MRAGKGSKGSEGATWGKREVGWGGWSYLLPFQAPRMVRALTACLPVSDTGVGDIWMSGVRS